MQFIAVVVCLAAATAAHAYVVDLLVIEGKRSACPEWYSRVDKVRTLDGDLNQAAGGPYLYLCVKYGNHEEAVIDVKVYARSSDKYETQYDSACEHVGSDWAPVPKVGDFSGDINYKAGGPYVYLCYRKGPARASPGPIGALKLTEDQCDDGAYRAATAGSSDGDLNQKAGGKYIYLCFMRECIATQVVGRWLFQKTLIGKSTMTFKYGTSQKHGSESLQTWTKSVTSAMRAGLEVAGVGGMSTRLETSVRNQIAQRQSYEWSNSREMTEVAEFGDDDEGKSLWQFVFESSDSCGSKKDQILSQQWALTKNRDSPPCCLPGFATDGVAYQKCSSQKAVLPNMNHCREAATLRKFESSPQLAAALDTTNSVWSSAATPLSFLPAISLVACLPLRRRGHLDPSLRLLSIPDSTEQESAQMVCEPSLSP